MADRRSAATKSAGKTPSTTQTSKQKASEAQVKQQASKGLSQQQRAEQSESGGRYVDASGQISQISGYEAPRPTTIVVKLSDSVGVSGAPPPTAPKPIVQTTSTPSKTTAYGGYGSAAAQQAALRDAITQQQKMIKEDAVYAAKVTKATERAAALQQQTKQPVPQPAKIITGQRDLAQEQAAKEQASIPFVTQQYAREGKQISPTSVEGQVIQRIIEEQRVAEQANIIQQQRFANITQAQSAEKAIEIIKAQPSPQVFFTFGQTGLADAKQLGLVGPEGQKITGQVVVEREPTRGLLGTEEGQAKILSILESTPRPSLQESLGYGIPDYAQPKILQPVEREIQEPIRPKGTTPYGGFSSEAEQDTALKEAIKKSQEQFPDAFAKATTKEKVTPVSMQYGIGETDVPVGPPLGETSFIPSVSKAEIPLIPGVPGFLGGLALFGPKQQEQKFAEEPIVDPFGTKGYQPLGGFMASSKARQEALDLGEVVLKEVKIPGETRVIPPSGTPTVDIKTITGLPDIDTRTYVDPLTGQTVKEKTTTKATKTTVSKTIPLGGIETSSQIYTQKGLKPVTPDFSDPLGSAYRGALEFGYNELVGIKDIGQQIYDLGRVSAGKEPVFEAEKFYATPGSVALAGVSGAALSPFTGEDAGNILRTTGKVLERTAIADPTYTIVSGGLEVGALLSPTPFGKAKAVKPFLSSLIKAIQGSVKGQQAAVPVSAKVIAKGKPTKAGIGYIIEPSGKPASIPLSSALREETGSLPGVSTAFARSSKEIKAETVAKQREAFETALQKGGVSEAEAKQLAKETAQKELESQKYLDSLVQKSKEKKAVELEKQAKEFYASSGKKGPAVGIPENIRRDIAVRGDLDFSPEITSRFGTKDFPQLPPYELPADARFREALGLGIKVEKISKKAPDAVPFTKYEEITATAIQSERVEKISKAKAIQQEGFAPSPFNEYLFGGPAGKIGGIVKGEDIIRFGDDFTGFGETAASKTKPKPPPNGPTSSAFTVTEKQIDALSKRANIPKSDAKTIIEKQRKRAEETGDDFGYRAVTTPQGLETVQQVAEETAIKSAKLKKLEKAADDLAEQKQSFRVSSIADQKTQRELSKLIKEEKLLTPEKATQKALKGLIREEKIKIGIKSLDETPVPKRMGADDIFKTPVPKKAADDIFKIEEPPRPKGRTKIGAATGAATGVLLGGLLYGGQQQPAEGVTTGYEESFQDPLLDIQSSVFQEQTKTKQTEKQKQKTATVQEYGYDFGYGQQQGQSEKTTTKTPTRTTNILDIFQSQSQRQDQSQQIRQEEFLTYRYGGGNYPFGEPEPKVDSKDSARRFYRVFEVAKTPFGKIERGLGTQVQSSAPIFELSDVLGQPKQSKRKQKRNDMFSMDF